MVTKYHKGRHSLFLYNSEIFYAFTQDILRSRSISVTVSTRRHSYISKLLFFLQADYIYE
ncbi:hypothetical protein EFR94_12760 [Levilactobacillus brevis]|nr:hypothetical protein [Levilactobacillus brevis]